MFKKVFGEGNDFFALDISATAIRVIELSKGPGGWKYERSNHQFFDPNLVSDSGKVAESIKKAIDSAGIKAKNVIISLPDEVSTVKITEIKKSPDKKISEIIESQIKKLESRQGEQNYEYLTLSKSKSDNEKTEVLIATADKSFIEDRIGILESIGLNVIAIEPEPLSLIRSVATSNGAQLIINLKDFTTDYVISDKKVPYYTKTVPFGAGLFVGMLQQNMQLDTATAQKYVADYGLNPEILNGQITVALGSAIHQFINEIFNAITIFEKKYPHSKVKKIILTGYGTVIPHFLETISQQTGMTVKSADLWRDITVTDKEKSELDTVISHFAVAIGLAKKEVNP